MTDRNWEAELAKIDKQLASVSDEQLLAESRQPPVGKAGQAALPAGKPVAPPSGKAAAKSSAPSLAATPTAGSWRGWVKVTIAVAAAAGLMFWPWPARCGPPLLGFTAATIGVSALGMWSAVGTWRHRLGLAHVASLLVTVWGLALGAREILPRAGYAIPTDARAAQWSCDGLPPAQTETAPLLPGAPVTTPQGARPATGAAGGPFRSDPNASSRSTTSLG